MFNLKQRIGASVFFQHRPFRWIAEHLRVMGFGRMELRGIARHLDLASTLRQRLDAVASHLDQAEQA